MSGFRGNETGTRSGARTDTQCVHFLTYSLQSGVSYMRFCGFRMSNHSFVIELLGALQKRGRAAGTISAGALRYTQSSRVCYCLPLQMKNESFPRSRRGREGGPELDERDALNKERSVFLVQIHLLHREYSLLITFLCRFRTYFCHYRHH